MEENKNIYKLEMHEFTWVSGADMTAIRVPGGWIYRGWDEKKQEHSNAVVFVPFNNEFQIKS